MIAIYMQLQYMYKVLQWVQQLEDKYSSLTLKVPSINSLHFLKDNIADTQSMT